jgi:hypothetical protein
VRVGEAILTGAGMLVALAIAIALGYEMVAILKGWLSISDIVAGQTEYHRWLTGMILLIVGIVIGGLTVHFTGFSP